MNLSYLTRLFRELRLRRFGDIAYRLYHGTLNRLGILRRRFPAVTPHEDDFVRSLKPGGPASMSEFVEQFDSRREPVFYFDHGNSESFPVGSLHGDETPTDLLRAAERILQRRYRALGSREVQFNGHVAWLHSLNGDAHWPADRHWTQIDFRRASDRGDVKSCWEWNRHHGFVTLGRAYRYTGDERYVEEFARLLDWWCEQNPPEMGVNYASNLEIGLRCVSWLWAHHLMAPSRHYPSRSRARLHLFLFYMARHLAGNLSYTAYTGRNNHLIGDASCLAVWCLLYPEVRASNDWLDRALTMLWAAIDEQVFSDGMHFELSFGYHQFVLELALQVVLLLRRNGRDVPARASARLAQMTEALAAVVQPDGLAPNFNDNDDGFVWALHDSPGQRLKSLLEIGAALFDRPDFLAAAESRPTEQAMLVLGSGQTERPSAANVRAVPSAVRFDRAGVYVMRSGRGDRAQFALINNHPDPFPNSGHNHASLLQLLLWTDGKPLLIDGGTYRYNDDRGWRNALRGTHAHNTVVVDGLDQAEPFRKFGWLSKLRPGESRFRETDDFVIYDGNHDSYGRLPQPVRHRRSVVWIKQPCAWVVRDELTGKGTHTFQQLWHLPGPYRVSGSKENLLEVDCGDGVAAGIQLLTAADDTIEFVCGDRQRLWSWESPRYGTILPRRSVVLEWTAAVPTTRVAAFFPMRELEAHGLPVRQAEMNRLSIWSGLFDLEFETDSIRCERKDAPCEATSCPSSSR